MNDNLKNTKEDLTDVVNFIESVNHYIHSARKQYIPEITDDMLLEKGAPILINGENGMKYDFALNGRISNIGVFLSNGNPLMVIQISTENTMQGFLFRPGNERNEITLPTVPFPHAGQFARYLYNNADRKNIFNKTLEYIFSQN